MFLLKNRSLLKKILLCIHNVWSKTKNLACLYFYILYKYTVMKGVVPVIDTA